MAQQNFAGLSGPLTTHVEVGVTPRTYTPPLRIFLHDETEQNVGILLLAVMAHVGSHQLYWWPANAKKIHTPEQIAYFKPVRQDSLQ